MHRYSLIIPLLFLITGTALFATVVYVGPAETYPTISAAMYNVTDGDTIIVRDGVYPKNIIVRNTIIPPFS